MKPAYQEFVEFIASGSTTSEVAGFVPSQQAKDRAAELLFREKAHGLASEEKAELAHYQGIEHVMRLASARARELLAKK